LLQKYCAGAAGEEESERGKILSEDRKESYLNRKGEASFSKKSPSMGPKRKENLLRSDVKTDKERKSEGLGWALSKLMRGNLGKKKKMISPSRNASGFTSGGTRVLGKGRAGGRDCGGPTEKREQLKEVRQFGGVFFGRNE